MTVIEIILFIIIAIGSWIIISLIFLLPNFSFKRKITNKTYEEKTEIYNKWKNNEIKYTLQYSLIPLVMFILTITREGFNEIANFWLLAPVLFYINIKQIHIKEEYKIPYLENFLMLFVFMILVTVIQGFIKLSSV